MGDTRVSGAERAATAAFANAVIGRIVGEIEKKYKIWRGLPRQSEELIRCLNTLALGMDDELVKCGGTPRTAVARAYGQEMRALTHDIEDCLERFLHRVTSKDGSSRFHVMAHNLNSVPRCFRFAAEIRALKRRLQSAGNRVFNPPGNSQVSSTPIVPRLAAGAFTDCPVGIEKATKDLCALLEQPNRVILIAVVGFGGSGKTTIARAVYNSVSSDTFSCRVWVSVGFLEKSDHVGILTDIHEQLQPGQPFSLPALKECLRLQKKRYLIVIDGIKDKHMQDWDIIRSIFKGSGGVLLTTTSHSVANNCTTYSTKEMGLSHSERPFGYVYTMKALSIEDSQKVSLPWRCSPELLQGSGSLLAKCDGHPLALSCVANHLSCQDEPTGKFCMELCRDLGSYLAWDGTDEPNFSRLRGVLFDSFTSLPDHFIRTCFLYLGIFPVDHVLKRNVIIRRWCAEGYTRSDPEVSEKTVADRYFKILVERNVIQPATPNSGPLVKMCRIHGIVHAFILHKSVSEKFITMFDAESHGAVRHLVVCHGNTTDSGTTSKLDLTRARSLTVFGNGGAAISDFSKYKLIRVLDLEACNDLHDDHLKDICKLWNLRYLSLGPGISAIPKEIAKLKLLETLDISKTTANVLPWVVIGLRSLVHLIGRFTLHVPVGNDREKLNKYLARSKLETLSGFTADGSHGLLQLMPDMKTLNKVKIWISYDGDGLDLNNQIARVIPGYLEQPILEGNTRSLSLDFQAVPEGSLYALRELYNSCLHSGKSIHLSLLKLRGSFSVLPEFVPVLKGLSQLCLSPSSVTQGLI
ncbi:unnamed protein product [Urochloa decumbens]|uniref:NB-ARC domain-containing protein n=1 Tax=Urochloa decumbens TaxID=240449 RepID=A0ABC9DIQ3_9POAL